MARRKTNGFSSGEENINHYGAIRLRVTGSGNLQATLFSLDEVQSFQMVNIPLASVNNQEPTRLSNFTQQRAKLLLQVSNINESFTIKKIIVFIKPVAKNYPG